MAYSKKTSRNHYGAVTMSGYECRNRWVFSSRRNTGNDGVLRTVQYCYCTGVPLSTANPSFASRLEPYRPVAPWRLTSVVSFLIPAMPRRLLSRPAAAVSSVDVGGRPGTDDGVGGTGQRWKTGQLDVTDAASVRVNTQEDISRSSVTAETVQLARRKMRKLSFRSLL